MCSTGHAHTQATILLQKFHGFLHCSLLFWGYSADATSLHCAYGVEKLLLRLLNSRVPAAPALQTVALTQGHIDAYSSKYQVRGAEHTTFNLCVPGMARL